jgi:two-component system, chemotaxis family, CheB/CheR fusion protein
MLEPVAPESAALPARLVARMSQVLREHGATDFEQYKTSTRRRRIERRMAVHGLDDGEPYLELLAASAVERQILEREFLVGVTAFFRDPALWQRLQADLLPDLLAGCAPRTALRAWVAGCSTGEEAYSLAMLCAELAERGPAGEPKIFATDLNPEAVRAARRGVYRLRDSETLPADRRAAFFRASGGSLEAVPSLRDRLVFARHDITRDPPFSRPDLLMCRNLLIYLRPEAQRRVLQLFHFSLRPGGLLVLGRSESVGPDRSLFVEVDSRLRVYARSGAAAAPRVRLIDAPTPHAPAPDLTPPLDMTPAKPPAAGERLQRLAEELVLQRITPAVAVVDAQGEIIFLGGREAPYLEAGVAKVGANLVALAAERLRGPLAAALQQLQHGAAEVRLRGLPVGVVGASAAIDVELQRMSAPEPLHGRVLVVFRELGDPGAAPRLDDVGDAAVLRGDLDRAVAQLQQLRDEMRRVHEDHQAATEEMQSANEELQATNEELTTSREELQSMNEELQSVNSELSQRLEDLQLAQSDIRNLLNSTQVAALFLDNELRVRRFTERSLDIVHLRDGDIGRPLSDLTSGLDYPEMLDDARRVLRDLASVERTVRHRDGRTFRARTMPYRTLSDVIEGVVMTFIEVDEHTAGAANGGLPERAAPAPATRPTTRPGARKRP